MRELIRGEKQEKLEALAGPIREKGVEVPTNVLHGKTSVVIIREVLRGDHDLVLRVAKGKDSHHSGFFGTTANRLLRKCPSAVWLVLPTTTPKFFHVLDCVDTSAGEQADAELNNKVYELAASISQYHDGRLSIVHAWSIYGEQMLKGRTQANEFVELVEKNLEQASSLLDKFLEKHGIHYQDDNVHLLKGGPSTATPHFIRENGVDWVLMATVGRCGLSGMIVRNTAEPILNRIHRSALELKRDRFKCPIRMSD